MDQIDCDIIAMLEEDSRMPYSSIAKKVKLSSTAVNQRVQKLMEEGIILGFGLKLNKAKLGITIQAIISVKLNFAKIDSFYKILLSFQEVEACYRVTGEECIIMKVNLRDNAHLLQFINQISNYGFSKSSIIIEQLKG